GDVADLGGEVRCHGVDVVGQIPPGTGDALDLRLTTELALGAHFPRHAGDLVGEGRELVDHGVDGGLEGEDLTAGVHRDLLRQVTLGDRGRHRGDVAHLGGEVAGELVHVL